MIRFMADTWADAILRPIAMAAPNGGVYIEIMAPDFRFLLVLCLAVFVLISNRRATAQPKNWLPAAALFVLIFFSFVPWMNTTGNGRYFMPYIILIGPLCIGLINLLHSTVNMKLFLVVAVLCIQGVAINQNNPWKPFDSWEWIPWKDAPYFSLDIPQQEGLDPDSTYVTIASQTLSLTAPLFPPSSHWISLTAFGSTESDKQSALYAPVKKALRESKSLKLFQSNAPRAMIENSVQPNQNAINAINPYLEAHDLRLKTPTDCQLIKSKTLSYRTFIDTNETPPEKKRIIDQSGFWICSIEYATSPKTGAEFTPEELIAKSLFEKMEKICPRFFGPGQKIVSYHPAGFLRKYSGSDSLLISTRDGNLYFKYERALNPQLIGKADDVLSQDFNYDCTKFRGRAGLPWEREI